MTGSHAVAAMCVALLACGKSNESSAVKQPTNAPPASEAESPGAPNVPTCPATGLWAECSLLYRLERAGLAPSVDSGATASEAGLDGTPLLVKIGLSAHLEVHLYPDSTARSAAVAKLDRSQFVNGTAPQTIKRERTLIESANLVALLTSINGHQRERVSDALTAGPPQPAKP